MVIFLGETELYDNDNGNASKVLAHLGVLTIWYFRILALLWSAAISSGNSFASSCIVASIISESLHEIHSAAGAKTSSNIERLGS